MFFVIAFLSVFSALGYGSWDAIRLFGMQFLDFFDFITNSALMPVVALLTCVLVGYILKPKAIEDEVRLGQNHFQARWLYRAMIYVAPVLIALLLVSEIARALGLGGWHI